MQPWRLNWISGDGRLLLAARVLRTFGYGYLAVVLGLYLAALGMSAFVIGLLTAAAIGGSAALTVAWSLAADRYGRRRTVMTMAVLMADHGRSDGDRRTSLRSRELPVASPPCGFHRHDLGDVL